MKKLLLFAMAIIFAMQLSAQTMFHVVGDTTTLTTSPLGNNTSQRRGVMFPWALKGFLT